MDALNKLKEVVEQFCEHIYEATEIFLGNPDDLIEMDWSKVPSNCYFISSFHVDKGNVYKVEDEKLKRNLYEFIEAYPDRVFRGER